jgi:ligand-binding sensor domain-containing protein
LDPFTSRDRRQYFAGTDSGVFLSTDNGISWNAVNAGLASLNIQLVAVIGGIIFAGTYGHGIFLSTNNGTSWNAVNAGPPRGGLTSLVVIGGNLFAGTYDGGDFLSTDNGTSWTTVNTGLPTTDVRSLAVIGGTIFAGTQGGGVYLSTNNGTSWTAVNSGLANTMITSLAISDGILFAKAYGGGVWRRPLSEMTGIIDQKPRRETMQQAHFKISPTGSTLTVEFTIPHPDRVTVTMYDLAGKEISSLVNRHLDAGSYRYFRDTRALPRGCYAVRLRAGATDCVKLVRIMH